MRRAWNIASMIAFSLPATKQSDASFIGSVRDLRFANRQQLGHFLRCSTTGGILVEHDDNLIELHQIGPSYPARRELQPVRH